MSEAPDEKKGNGTAIGVATLVAGLVGTLASTLFSGKQSRKERAQKQVEQRLQAIEDQTSQALEQLGKVVEGLSFTVPGDSRRAERRARHVARSARRLAERTAASTRRQVAELDREALRLQALEKANQLGHEGSQRAGELARLLNLRASELIADNRSHLPEWKARASRSASDTFGKGTTLVHQAFDSAPEVTAKVSAMTSEAAHNALDRSPDVADKVSKTLEHVAQRGAKVAGQVREGTPTVLDKASKSAHDALDQAQHRAPEVRELAHVLAVDASQRAHHIAEQAKVHAPEVGAQVATALHSAQDAAKPVLSDVASFAARLMEDAREAGSHAGDAVLPEVQHRVDAVAARAKTQGQASATTLAALGANAGDKLTHTTDVIEQQSKAVASAAGRGTKDGGSLIVWTLAAAGIVYYAFLNEGQRAKARESGQRIVAEIKEVVRDIRGYDEEFS